MTYLQDIFTESKNPHTLRIRANDVNKQKPISYVYTESRGMENFVTIQAKMHSAERRPKFPSCTK